MNKYLVKLANHLDKKGLHKEADYVDWIIKESSTESEFEKFKNLIVSSPEKFEGCSKSIKSKYANYKYDFYNQDRKIRLESGQNLNKWMDAITKDLSMGLFSSGSDYSLGAKLQKYTIGLGTDECAIYSFYHNLLAMEPVANAYIKGRKEYTDPELDRFSPLIYLKRGVPGIYNWIEKNWWMGNKYNHNSSIYESVKSEL